HQQFPVVGGIQREKSDFEFIGKRTQLLVQREQVAPQLVTVQQHSVPLRLGLQWTHEDGQQGPARGQRQVQPVQGIAPFDLHRAAVANRRAYPSATSFHPKRRCSTGNNLVACACASPTSSSSR